MKKRAVIFYAVWLGFSCLLYFFENNTGTRIVLLCSLLLPLFPPIRRAVSARDESAGRSLSVIQTVQAFTEQEEDDPGNVRAYLPGDPVNRIHWKLSARLDEPLVREQTRTATSAEAEKTAVSEDEAPAAGSFVSRIALAGLPVLLVSLLLLAAVPSANEGLRALMNRLFDASEAVNAYAYARFDVPADQPVAFAVMLLSAAGLSIAAMVLLSRSRLPALGLMVGIVSFQIYFGLSFPAWVQVMLFCLFAFWMMKRSPDRRTILYLAAVIAAASAAVSLLYPGVDALTEAASESIRDRISQMAQSIAGTTQEVPAGESETRHVHTQSLTEGDREATPDREYRLVTVEEEQISVPHWIDYARIILLLLLTAALVILPFVPFVLLNQRRKKALDARKAFQSENISEAVFAIFQHITLWLEATGRGEDNLPYAAWSTGLSPDYAERFAACEKLFEEAAYSTHEMKEEHRQQALALLHETEQTLLQAADWKQRLRLRYKECLWL